MDILFRHDLADLAAVTADRTVSIFLPTHRCGPDVRPVAPQDLIRWKNLVREADERLRAQGAAGRDVDALLGPASALTDDTEFWQFQGDGLAAFAAPGRFRTFRVPMPLDELVVVAPRFHVKPLLPLLVGDGRFYILALSQNEVRLVEATRETAAEVDLGAVPGSLQETLRFNAPEKQLQFHTGAPRGDGRRRAMFHGHGVGTDDRKDNVLWFCRQIDRGLDPVLRDGSAPLVLAAVESVAAIYREANTYRHLVKTIVPGNPEDLSAKELHARAWPLVEPIMHAERDAALARYGAARDTGKAIGDLETTLGAAADGRIDVLFIPGGVQRWGRFDESTRTAKVHASPEAGDEDLLNDAAVRTVLAGGTVYVVPPEQLASGDTLAALLRY